MKKIFTFFAAALMSVSMFAQSIGPEEVIELGNTGCVGTHYQVLGGGTGVSS